MKKLMGLLILGLLFGLTFASFGSAYYFSYGSNDDYSRRTYHSTYEHNGEVRATDYDRSTLVYRLPNGDERRVFRVERVTTTSPSYGSGYYGSYSPDYRYSNYYSPWYQKYWNQPIGYYSGYGNYHSYY